MNVLPWPGSLSAWMWPPCASTTERAIARPIPVPPSSPRTGRCRPGRTARTAGAGARRGCRRRCRPPRPRTEPLCRCAETATAPPGGVNRTALSTRLNRTWCTRSRSAIDRRQIVGDRRSDCTPRSGRAPPRSRTTPGRRAARAPRPRGAAARRPTRAATDPAAARPAGPAARTARASPASVSGSGCSTPSSRFSRCARIAVIGVFSSCETFATRSRRRRSRPSSSPLIRLKAVGELADLVPAASCTRAWSSRPSPCAARPAPCRAAAGSCPRASHRAMTRAMTAATAPGQEELPPDALQEPEGRGDPAQRNPREGEGAQHRHRAAVAPRERNA